MANPPPLSELAPCPHDAIENLRTSQQQLDMDGIIVGVSRQALEEVLAYVDARRPSPPALEGALEASLVAMEKQIDTLRHHLNPAYESLEWWAERASTRDIGDPQLMKDGAACMAMLAAITQARLSLSERGEYGSWCFDMDKAPKNGTEVQAAIPGHGTDNVIAWQDGLRDTEDRDCGGWTFTRDQEPPDSWTDGVCWTVNEDGVASVAPVAWMPLPQSPAGR